MGLRDMMRGLFGEAQRALTDARTAASESAIEESRDARRRAQATAAYRRADEEHKRAAARSREAGEDLIEELEK